MNKKKQFIERRCCWASMSVVYACVSVCWYCSYYLLLRHTMKKCSTYPNICECESAVGQKRLLSSPITPYTMNRKNECANSEKRECRANGIQSRKQVDGTCALYLPHVLACACMKNVSSVCFPCTYTNINIHIGIKRIEIFDNVRAHTEPPKSSES